MKSADYHHGYLDGKHSQIAFVNEGLRAAIDERNAVIRTLADTLEMTERNAGFSNSGTLIPAARKLLEDNPWAP